MSTERWLAIVGVGEDGIEGLTPAARRLIAQARFVVGGKRHLALVGPLAAETLVWPSPIEGALDAIEARRGKPVCVVATGDPFFFGVGSLLMRRFAADEMICAPAPSAFALAAARLGWGQQDCALLSLHGRPLEAIIPHLQPGARILALSWDDATPAKLAALLHGARHGTIETDRLRGDGRPARANSRHAGARIRAGECRRLEHDRAGSGRRCGARVLSRAPGLPDEWFEHDGQITKREIRAMTLSALGPRRGEMLWDVGAGSGSVAIEWMLADPANRAVAIEARADRAARIARNSLSFGTSALAVVAGEAPEAFAELPEPNAVFIGGGAGAPGLIERALEALQPEGRLVVNAVTLETQASCVAWRARWGGDLVRIAVEHAEPLGRYSGWRAAMPVVQWRLHKR